MITHYDWLGVSQTDTIDDIKLAYRRLANKHHPDKSKDPRSAEAFKFINVAYGILSDEDKRKKYDESLSFNHSSAGPSKNITRTVIDSFFASLVDHYITVDGFKLFCPANKPLKVDFTLPNGQLVRVISEEQQGNWTRLKNILFVNIHVTFVEAIYGVDVDLTTPFGETILFRIHAGTQPNEKFIFKDKGIYTNNSRSDIVAVVQVSIPNGLTEDVNSAIIGRTTRNTVYAK